MTTNTARFAQRELSILSKLATDPENRPMVEPFIPELLALCEKFGLSGQSGGSTPMTARALSQAVEKLCLQNPISPIMDFPEEWVDVAEYAEGKSWFQNARCAAVFKDGEEGRPYYLDAIVFVGDKTGQFTGHRIDDGAGGFIGSSQYIKQFPFTPKTFYIDVVDHEVKKDFWEHTVKNERQLKSVFKYYDRFPA